MLFDLDLPKVALPVSNGHVDELADEDAVSGWGELCT
jgi:hypothetical protein